MKRLMVVDDEAVITTQLEDRLQSMKYDVVGTASTGKESAKRKKREETCHLFGLMPDVFDEMDEFVFCGSVRQKVWKV